MTRSLLIDAIGTVIGIDGSALTDDAWSAVKIAWQDAVSDAGPGIRPVATVVAHGGIPEQSLLSGLSIDVTLAALEAQAGTLLLLHAAGLATADGRVVALVGPSGRGKTTASRVLGREFGYVSDESVGIAADGTVMPYRKPLSLIEGANHPKVQRSPTELGLHPLPSTSLRLAALVLLERTTDVRSPVVEPVDTAEAIARLAEQASYLGLTPAPLHLLSAHIDAVGEVRRLVYSDAASLAPIIRELAGQDPRRDRTPRAPDALIPPSEPPLAGADGGLVDTPRFCRAPIIDALMLDGGRIAVLARAEQETRVTVLDGIAPALWLHLRQPASLPELVREAVAVHGLPDGLSADALVEEAIDELLSADVLIRC